MSDESPPEQPYRPRAIHGRGTATNPGNRFERMHMELDGDEIDDARAREPDEEEPLPRTTFFRDDSQSIISKNSSPDIGFDFSLNPYRGCEHGCAYCYARPYHEYLGFNAGLDFESKIMVKESAAELLEKELSAKKWVPKTLACSGVTDCYQPAERKLRITRECVEVLAETRHPVGFVTKNRLITRDLDLLTKLARYRAVVAYISVTTLDSELARVLEPRASMPNARLMTIKKLADAGIPVGVSAAPMIPGLNDHEIPAILEAAADHGARAAFYTVVRLPHGVSDVFQGWLEDHRPGEKDKILGRIREMRGGKLYDARFGSRMRGEGAVAKDIETLFRVSAQRFGLDRGMPRLSTAAFKKPCGAQMVLF